MGLSQVKLNSYRPAGQARRQAERRCQPAGLTPAEIDKAQRLT